MPLRDRTIIIIDDDLDFTPQDFMTAWNSEQSDGDLPMASLVGPGRTFDASLMAIVGDVASVLQIVGFIGMPTVVSLVQKIRKRRTPDQPGMAGKDARVGFEVDETVIDLDREGKVRKITIRRAVG